MVVQTCNPRCGRGRKIRRSGHPWLHTKFKTSLDHIKKKKIKPGVMAYSFNPSTWRERHDGTHAGRTLYT